MSGRISSRLGFVSSVESSQIEWDLLSDSEKRAWVRDNMTTAEDVDGMSSPDREAWLAEIPPYSATD